MATFKRWLFRIIVGLAGIIVLAVAAIYLISGARLGKHWDITPESVAIPTDSASIARGAHVAMIRGCRGCHTENLSGGTFLDAPIIAQLWARNLTPGKGGAGAYYTNADWVRSIRHGVRPDGSALLFMPAQDFNGLNDRDLGALIAWVKTVPPVDTAYPKDRVGFLGRVLYLAGALPLVPAEVIHHTAPRPADVPEGETVAYGRYLASACSDCHGSGFSGGKVPGAPPGMLPARNLTPDSTSGIGKWSLADFREAIRTGKLPDGVQIDTIAMPIRESAQLNPIESSALFRYFMSLPAKPYGNR